MTQEKTHAEVAVAVAKPASAKPDNARREALAKLLGVAAGGAALQALAGCLAPGISARDEETGLASDALAGRTFIWVNTIGVLATEGLRAQTADIENDQDMIAIVEGYYAPGDGGGGVFYWDPGNRTDDGGTTIVAGEPLGSTVEGPAWRRIDSGPLNVRWFGANGDVYQNATPGIERAIAAALANPFKPKAVYLPAGHYVVHSSVVLPRLNGLSGGGFTFFGDGPQMTVLEANVSVAPQNPVITFDNEAYGVSDVTIKGMSVIHGNRGYGIAHFSDGNQRAERIALTDLYVSTYKDSDLGQYSPIYLHRVFSSRLDRIRADGGESVLFLRQCARCTVVDFITGHNNHYMNGIRIEGGGGSHHILRARIEECGTQEVEGVVETPGNGILIQADATGKPSFVVIESTNFEGWTNLTQVHVKDGTHVTFVGCHMADVSPAVPNGLGILLGANAHHVRFIGGRLRGLYDPGTPESIRRALKIEAGATDIFFDTAILSSSDLDKDLLVDTAAKRVRLRIVHDRNTIWHEYTKLVGVVSELQPISGSPGEYLVQGYGLQYNGGEVQRIPGTANVYTLEGGYEGQMLTLTADGGGTVQPGGNINLAGGVAFNPTSIGYGTLTLLCYKSGPGGLEAWREVSRSINA